MAEVVPLNFPIPAESAIASYSYTDVAEGTGVQIFYGSTYKVDTTLSYFLTTQGGHYANDTTSSANIATGDPAKVLDLDFDLPLNLPKNIKGNLYVTATIGCSARNAGTSTLYYIAKLRKWDGSTETDIASAQSATITNVNSPSVDTLSTKITVPLTHYKKTDTIRLTMEVWAGQSGGSSTAVIYHDPIERASALPDGETQRVIGFIPFRLDL